MRALITAQTHRFPAGLIFDVTALSPWFLPHGWDRPTERELVAEITEFVLPECKTIEENIGLMRFLHDETDYGSGSIEFLNVQAESGIVMCERGRHPVQEGRLALGHGPGERRHGDERRWQDSDLAGVLRPHRVGLAGPVRLTRHTDAAGIGTLRHERRAGPWASTRTTSNASSWPNVTGPPGGR
jgi:hypothetical protein